MGSVRRKLVNDELLPRPEAWETWTFIGEMKSTQNMGCVSATPPLND